MRLTLPVFALLMCLSASAQTQADYAAQVAAASPSVVLDFNDATSTFREHRTNVDFIPSAGGTITPHLAGFDSARPNNTAASFTYNAFAKSPNSTLGSFEWTQPFSVQFHIDNLQMTRSATEYKYILSKGDLDGSGWVVYLHYDSGGDATQICFVSHVAGGFAGVSWTVCTLPGGGFDLLNGYNYNIVYTHDGTGNPTTGDAIYINGLPIGSQAYGDGNALSLGAIQITLSGGTGYATSTAFTSSGGGSGCVVAGTMSSASGVPASVSYANNYGCTSAPTITLTSPTGTGVTITRTANSGSMVSTQALYINGYHYSGGDAAGGTSGDPVIKFDELAIFPSVVDQYFIHGTFTHTKFFQSVISAPPADPPYVIFSDDGLGDEDNFFSLEEVIAAHLRGYIRLIAVNQDDGGTSIQLYRQMLDAAGLHHVPVSSPSVCFSCGGTTESGVVSAYNASTPSTYPAAATVYRRALAALPAGKKAVWLSGGGDRSIMDLMTSSADGISALSGSAMFAADIAELYLQGEYIIPFTCTPACSNDLGNDWAAGQYMMANNGSVPIRWFTGTPSSAGPGLRYTHSATDPFRRLQVAGAWVSDSRTCWDCLPATNFLTSAFQGTPVSGTLSITDSTHVQGVTSPNSQHYTYPLSSLSDPGGSAAGYIYSWFLNSLINVSPQGRPRGN